MARNRLEGLDRISRDSVEELVQRLGERGAAEALGLARATLERALSGLPVAAVTRTAIRARLQLLAAGS